MPPPPLLLLPEPAEPPPPPQAASAATMAAMQRVFRASPRAALLVQSMIPFMGEIVHRVRHSHNRGEAGLCAGSGPAEGPGEDGADGLRALG